MSPLTVIDKTASLSPNNYSPGRAGMKMQCIVLHDTVGTLSMPDSNQLTGVNYLARELSTANFLLTSGQASVHYMIGAEAVGGKIYRLCREKDTAWHAAGTPVRNVFVAPDGTRLEGGLEGVSKINLGSIGIERWGAINEPIGAEQLASMTALVCDIALRYKLTAEQIVSHKWLQTDRADGEVLLIHLRNAVTEMWHNINGGIVPFPDTNVRYFPETNQYVINYLADGTRLGFLDYWRNNGGLSIFGYPISGATGDDSRFSESGLIVQWFERARFELHADGTVKLGLVGLEANTWLPKPVVTVVGDDTTVIDTAAIVDKQDY
jgi:hypothetical protein